MKTVPCPAELPEDAPFSPVAPEKVISGAPRQAHHVFHASADGKFCAGIYACTPGAWRVSYDEEEFVTLVSGHIRLTNAAGEMQEFSAPGSFVIPAGFRGTWEALTEVRKMFAIYERQGEKK